MTSLVYRKLDITINEIRLLRLLPAADSANDAPVQCILDYHSLANPPPYTALSYLWGNSKDRVSIFIGDETFLATRNLENALRNLRARGIYQIWADAICINQDDLYERGEQINRMGTIYQCAKTVIAWVGEDEDIQNKVFPTIKRLHDNSSTRVEPAHSNQPVKFGVKQSSFCHDHPDIDDVDWEAMVKFFEIPYWKRVWIIQELAFGQKVQLACGLQTLPFSTLGKVIEMLDTHFPAIGEHSALDNARQIKEIRSMIFASTPIGLVEVLVRSNKAESSEEKDRLYGLLSLARSPFSNSLPCPDGYLPHFSPKYQRTSFYSSAIII